MKRVKLLRIRGDGVQDHFATVLFDGKQMTYDGLSTNTIRDFEKYGINAKDEILYPNDGLKFLEGLKYEFSGSIIRATNVEDVI